MQSPSFQRPLPNQPIGLYQHPRQGMGSRTYVVDFEDGTQKIVQLRAPTRTIPTDIVDQARSFLGEFLPACRYLGEFGLPDGPNGHAYEMTYLPGADLAMLMRRPAYDPETMLPTIARGVGKVLGRCSTGVPAKADAYGAVLEELISSIRAKLYDPDFHAYKMEMEELLDKQDALCRVPSVFTNDDLHFAAFIVSDDGEVAGLVDWEFVKCAPLGYDLGFIHHLPAPGCTRATATTSMLTVAT